MHSVGNYILGRSIGKGTFGKVRMATHSQLSEKVAIKILEKDKIKTRGDTERVTREIKILKQVQHPHIIQLYEIIETPKQVLLVMELAEGGELFNYIVSKHRLSERESCKYLAQILSGLEYLQKLRIVHRDLKPENLLLDTKKNLKIVDFGLSNIHAPNETLKTACGSPCYAAPEMIAGKRYHGSSADIWSCGVVLFAMLCGYLPFEDNNTSNLYKKILAGDFKIPSFLSAEAADLLKKVLVTDPDKRFNIEKIKSHAWFVKHFMAADVYGQEKVEFSEVIFGNLAALGFNMQQIKECLLLGKHNPGTAAYRILCNMSKQGKKPPEALKLRRSHVVTELPPEVNKSTERTSTRGRAYGSSVSPAAYRPITSYALPMNLIPTSLPHRQYQNPSPRVKTPINYLLEFSNTLKLAKRGRSPRIGTAAEVKRVRDSV